MQKDTIYIDVDDDITAIIGKVKASGQDIIALVPPKRIGVLQSAVNLRLVQRAAAGEGKKLVLVTHNDALMALAGSAGIPVAKSLTSTPEVPAATAAVDAPIDEIIEGDALPVGDHAKMPAPAAASPAVATPAADIPDTTATKPGKRLVPDFNSFRHKFVLIGAAVVAFIGFMIWAIMFAPNARIIISARTTDIAVNKNITLSETAPTDSTTGVISVKMSTIKKPISIPITATGKKDLGTKASGTVTLINCTDFDKTLAAGTAVSANGLNYLINKAVTVPASNATFGGACKNDGVATVGATAQNSGEQYNSGAQSYTVAGASGFKASSTGMTGGTTKMATVVSASDVQSAMDKMSETNKPEDLQKQLAAELTKVGKPIEKTYKADISKVKPSIAVDQEAADGKATLSGEAVYSMAGVTDKELETYFKGLMQKEIDGKPNQQVYESGAKTATFTNVNTTDKGYTSTVSSNGKVGPKIDEKEIKQFARGKRLGEIQAKIEAMSGVDSVDVKFSPFWVSSAPDDINRIKIEFKVNGEK